MSIIIHAPKGIAPKLNPRVLPQAQSQTAENCVLKHGDCRPLSGPSLVQALSSNTLAVFKIGGSWKQFNNRARVIASPVNAENNRYYYTLAAGGGKKTDTETGVLDLAVPRPDTGPSLTINGTGDGNLLRSSVYVYTRVTDWGEESAPSKPSGVLDVEYGQHITFSGLSDGSDAHVTHYRLYRAVGGETSNVWMIVPYQTTAGSLKYDSDNQIIYDIPKASVAGAKDGLRDDDLNISIEVESFHEPPDDLHSLTDFSNGLIGGLSGREVCFAHPWHPFAWPLGYRYQLDADGVGMGSMNGVPIVFTAQSVYLFDGAGPDSYHQRKISEVYGCESALSIAGMPTGVFFASKDGLCMAHNNGVDILTKDIWTKNQWAALVPSSLMGFYHDDSYYGFFIGSSKGFILPFGEESVSTFDLGNVIHGGYLEPAVGLYVILQATEGRGLYSFDSGTTLTSTWKSKLFRRPPVNYGAFRIVGEAGSSDIKIFYDGVEKYDETVTHNQAMRMPSGFTGRDIEVEIESGKIWSGFGLAGNIRELADNGV